VEAGHWRAEAYVALGCEMETDMEGKFIPQPVILDRMGYRCTHNDTHC
jgi:hypothetical protein